MNKIYENSLNISISNIIIADYIKELRKKKKITQLELANYLEKSTMTVIRYEKGFSIKLFDLGRIFSFLNATEEELVPIKKILTEKEYKIFMTWFYTDRGSFILEKLGDFLDVLGYDIVFLNKELSELPKICRKNIYKIIDDKGLANIITLKKENEIFLLDMDFYENLPYKLEDTINKLIKKNKLNK